MSVFTNNQNIHTYILCNLAYSDKNMSWGAIFVYTDLFHTN